ncbi:hypothetical protein MMC12_002779 [Toensbergia leucococca]|nr:hypothetical protein [Toensbergia leucococca]
MSAAVWPPIPHDELIKEEEDSLARELEWLLNTLQETLASLKSGLEECIALLAPKEPGSTLALSSLRSESVKGFVTRVGTRIVKGDIHLRLATLPLPRSLPTYPLHLSNPLPLPQLSHLLTLLNQSLDIIDITTWTGDPQNAFFIAGQLRLLADTIDDARLTLVGGEDVVGGRWWEDGGDEMTFSPPISSTLSFHLSISSTTLTLTLRTLGPVLPTPPPSTFPNLSLRHRLGLASKPPEHDEAERTFEYRGEEVRVREKVRVESQDPSLMAVMAKLSALGHGVAVWRRGLAVVMGEDEGE